MNLHAKRDRARLFHTLLGLAMAATILLGFSRTYYLKAWFDTPLLTLRLHLHGLVRDSGAIVAESPQPTLIAPQVTRRIVGASETWAHIGNWLIE